MLLLIWCVLGLLLGIFVHRRSVALTLGAVVWAISMATVAARTGFSVQIDGDSVGVLVTLLATMLGAVAGALLRERRSLDGVLKP
jgi:hypothetical protein